MSRRQVINFDWQVLVTLASATAFVLLRMWLTCAKQEG